MTGCFSNQGVLLIYVASVYAFVLLYIVQLYKYMLIYFSIYLLMDFGLFLSAIRNKAATLFNRNLR